MKYLPLICLLMFASSLCAEWEWAHTIGGADMERCWDIACDDQSNIFVSGEFMGSMMIEGQAYTAVGLTDSFVAKYDSAGLLLWVKVFGSPEEDCALGIDTDANGNCYVAGYYVDTLTCQGQTRISNGMWDAYVLKLDGDGNLQWLNSFGGTLNDIGYGIAVNASGQVYVAGWFADLILFSPISSITSAGGSDIYLTAWDANGNYRWARSAGTAGVEYGYKVACDNSGAAYVTGVAGAGTPFGNLILPTSGMYVVKYSAAGAEQWLAPSDNAMVNSIAVRPEPGISQKGLVCGRVVGSGAIGSFPFHSLEDSDDFYWAQFDTDTGNWSYAGYYGGTGSDKGRDCDFEHSPAFVGTYEAQATFYGQSFTSNGESDLVAGIGGPYNPQLICTGGIGSEVPSGIKILPNGTFAVSGWHYGLSWFGSYSIDSGDISNQNSFVACYNPATSVNDQLTPQAILSCHPNPFKSSVMISGLKAASPVRIFNLRGQLVKRGYASPEGSYLWGGANLSGTSCAAGLYLVQTSASTVKIFKTE